MNKELTLQEYKELEKNILKSLAQMLGESSLNIVREKPYKNLPATIKFYGRKNDNLLFYIKELENIELFGNMFKEEKWYFNNRRQETQKITVEFESLKEKEKNEKED